MQHATERVERPGESQEALDGKKATAKMEGALPLKWKEWVTSSCLPS